MSQRPPSSPGRPPRTGPAPKFVTGSILRHILTMTGAGAVGLMAIFLGDLANVLFLSLTGEQAFVAAVGYASSILFLTISIGIGLSIAATSLVAPALGAGDRDSARRLATNVHMATALTTTLLALLVVLSVPALLTWLGASGRTHQLAKDYLYILVPALPPLALGMTSSAVLRSCGDARRAMYVTLSGAIVNTLLDPLLIFGLGLGLHGAAIASAIARLAVMAIGLHGVARVHGLIERPHRDTFLADVPAIARIAVPALLTNIATPVANAYVTAAIAPFGDSSVAGWAIIGRILPVAFGAIYALSGSVGPVIGQNYGAGEHARMRETLTMSLLVTAVFTLVAWVLLALLADPLVALFKADEQAATLIRLFCRGVSPLFVFLGALFVANAVFNTLGRPHYSTALNWGRATLGTIPFVEIGGRMAGAEGVIAGNMVGAIPFGLLSVWICYRLIARHAREAANPPDPVRR